MSKPTFHSLQVTDARYYYLDLNPPRRPREMLVVCGGRELCNPDYKITRDGFQWHCLEFVVAGSGSLSINQREFSLQAGSVFYYGPGIPHVIRNNPQQPMLKYFVDFVGVVAEKQIGQSMLRDGNAVQSSAPSEILQIFDQMQRDGSRATPHSPAACAALLQFLIVKVNETAVDPRRGGSQALGTYRRCREYLDEHFTTLRAVDELAAACNVDVAYLCRLFKRFDFQSPYQTLLRLKMNRAAGQLLQTDLPVQQIAAALAYDDPYHFSRLFKSIYGKAPSHFRKSGHA